LDHRGRHRKTKRRAAGIVPRLLPGVAHQAQGPFAPPTVEIRIAVRNRKAARANLLNLRAEMEAPEDSDPATIRRMRSSGSMLQSSVALMEDEPPQARRWN